MFTCLKRNDKKEVKVAQLAGSVAEISAYHHGESSLMSTIINLAHNFVGSNNINLLQPIGQFGTRLQGGKDAASPRYIFTMLSPLAKLIFNPKDDPILTSNYDDNQKIEPEWYCPIIPMVLVNGCEGIGTGWSTKVQNYNPREIVRNIKRLIRGEEPQPMVPWFKNFKGHIESIDYSRYVCSGEVGRVSHNKYEITELPIREWTQHYKENVMEPLLQGSEKTPSLLSDYKEYHTDTTVKFTVTLPESNVEKVEDDPHKIFKLQTTLATSCMVLFDSNGVLRRFDSELSILREFFDVRMNLYEKRKKYMVGMLESEAGKLSNQARFIVEKCDGRLVIENKKKKDMIDELVRKNYDSDPVKAWKRAQDKDAALEEEGDSDDEVDTTGPDYDYLLGMAMWSLTKERKDELLKKRDDKLDELNILRLKTPSDLWNEDLDEFILRLDEVEEKERLDEAGVVQKKAKGIGRKKIHVEAMPSPQAERIVPRIDPELKRKAERANAAKENKGKKIKKEVVEDDEFDNIVTQNTGKSLTSRLGNSPDLIKKKAKLAKKTSDGSKQTTLNFKKSKKKATWNSDESMDEEMSRSDESDMDVKVEKRERASGSRRAAASKIKYTFSDEEKSSNSNSDEELHDNVGIAEMDAGPEKVKQFILRFNYFKINHMHTVSL